MANWYAFIGIGDPFVYINYRLVTVNPICPGPGEQICAVYLEQEGPIPESLKGVEIYIANALVTYTSQPDDIGQKHFVYVKSQIKQTGELSLTNSP
jgi:hypothetical protein